MKTEPVTKQKLRLVKSLSLKKNRLANGLFLVEGAKSVHELLKSPFDISFLIATQSFLDDNVAKFNKSAFQLFVAKVNDIHRSGSLKTNNSAIAVAKIPDNQFIIPGKNEYFLALDNVRDPGNLGTIMRIADWYGFAGLVLSSNCVDPFNPKTVISSMGSFTRVKVYQTNLEDYLHEAGCAKIGADMKGENIHTVKILPPAIIILGNESSGLSQPVRDSLDKVVNIPRFGQAESLNVAMAAAILCDNIRR